MAIGAIVAQLLPAALSAGMQLFGGGKDKYESFNYPTFQAPAFTPPQISSPEWLSPAVQETYQAIKAPAQYQAVSPDVVSQLMEELQAGTARKGQAQTYGLTGRGLLRSSIAERLLSDVARQGQEQERRFLSEVADINAQRKQAAEESRLGRMAQFVPQQQQLAQTQQQTEYDRALNAYLQNLQNEQNQYQQAYQQALMNWQGQQAQPRQDFSGIGEILGNIPWESVIGGIGGLFGGGGGIPRSTQTGTSTGMQFPQTAISKLGLMPGAWRNI